MSEIRKKFREINGIADGPVTGEALSPAPLHGQPLTGRDYIPTRNLEAAFGTEDDFDEEAWAD